MTMKAKILLTLAAVIAVSGAVALMIYPRDAGADRVAGKADRSDEAGGADGKAEDASAEGAATDNEDSSSAKVVKTDEEWREMLTPEQFRVAREGGTERAFGKAYHEFKKQGAGVYQCICCGAELFSSNEKFDSGCGWPSFYDPSKAKNVRSLVDLSHGMVRTEVRCARCDAHLGHVFEGEGFDTPTDKRFCINAVTLKFVPAEEVEKEISPDETSGEKQGEKGAE